MYRFLTPLIGIAMAITATNARATVIDFDSTVGFNNVSGGTYNEDGFTFSFGNGSYIHEFSNPNFNGFSSPVLEMDSTSASITRDGGGLFDFNTVLAVQSAAATPLIFTGIFADNSTIVSNIFAPLAQVPGAGTMTFAGFTNIKELQLSSVGNGFALYDNFTFDAGAPPPPPPTGVPAPGALVLLGFGLIGLVLRRRTT